jgi:hypothetical protein
MMNYTAVCNALNATTSECAETIVKSQNKLWFIVFTIFLVFAIIQIAITAMVPGKKKFGFFFGILALDIIMLMAMIIFYLMMPGIIEGMFL